MDDRYAIRLAQPADSAALAALERRCFSDPWSQAGLEEMLTAPAGFGLIAESAVAPLGYLLARAAAGQGEILNLAVVPESRRRGIGAAVLQAGLEELRGRGVGEVFLEVRESNLLAQALYFGRGFRVIGARKRYYRQPVEDALVLRLTLAPPA
jgi:ribosomal-protein-alanine N-acetyltransferase